MFATGIENSAPTIRNGKTRVDEMEKCGHYEKWREDFALVRGTGISFLRYGVPLHRVFPGSEKYDWEFTDLAFADLNEKSADEAAAEIKKAGAPDALAKIRRKVFRNR